MNTSEVLNLAADAIEKHGWAKGPGGWNGYGPNANLCLEGGIMAATGLTWEQIKSPVELWLCPAYRAVETYLDVPANERGLLFHWNDAENRTASEVIEVLRACAVIEASRERAAVQA